MFVAVPEKGALRNSGKHVQCGGHFLTLGPLGSWLCTAELTSLEPGLPVVVGRPAVQA